MQLESRKQLMFSGILFVTFTAIHVVSYVRICVMYGSTLFVLSYLVWQLTKTTKRYLPPKRISSFKKAVLITGCDTGFGHHLARRLYKEGYIVFAGCLSASGDGAKALRTDHSLERMHVLQMDVTKDSDVAAAVQEVKSKLTDGKVFWALVNNAGISTNGYVEMEPMEVYEKLIAVNLLGVVRVTKAFLPLIRLSRGRVVTVASSTGRLTFQTLVPYSMTKHAVVSFCDGLRGELLNWGIRVVSVEPSLYNTSMLPSDEMARSELVKKWNASDPEVREFYGEQSLQKVISLTVSGTKYAEPNINAVVESLVNAVSAEDPDDVYFVTPLIYRPFFWFLIVIPTNLRTVILDLVEKIIMKLGGTDNE